MNEIASGRRDDDACHKAAEHHAEAEARTRSGHDGQPYSHHLTAVAFAAFSVPPVNHLLLTSSARDHTRDKPLRVETLSRVSAHDCACGRGPMKHGLPLVLSPIPTRISAKYTAKIQPLPNGVPDVYPKTRYDSFRHRCRRRYSAQPCCSAAAAQASNGPSRSNMQAHTGSANDAEAAASSRPPPWVASVSR
jgi:hypothetical protein